MPILSNETELDSARARLRATVAALVEPEPGKEASHLARLLELDALAGRLGSLEESRRLRESVLALQGSLLSADHPDLLAAKQNLARARFALDDLSGALALDEQVLEARARLLPRDHPDLLEAKESLAVTKYALGDRSGAQALEEEALASRIRLLPPDHPSLLEAKLSIAATRRELGDLSGALALEEQVLEARVRLLPPDHPSLLDTRLCLARTRKALGDLHGAQVLEEQVLEARTRLLPADHPSLMMAKASLAATRRKLGDLAGAHVLEEEVRVAWTHLLLPEPPSPLAATKEALAPAELDFETVAASVGARLAPDAVAVSFGRHGMGIEEHPESGETSPEGEVLFAFLVLPSGATQRIDFGPVAGLEELVRDWRASLGRPLGPRPTTGSGAERTEVEIGRALRARLLDPLLATAGEDVRELHLVLEDFLQLVPLDALPLEGELLVGERYSICMQPSLAHLGSDARRPGAGGTLLAVGGIDFAAVPGLAGRVSEGQESSEATPIEAHAAPSSPPAAHPRRSTPFEPMRRTRYEVEDVAEQFHEAFGTEPAMLTRAAATKAALHAAAPDTRYLHLATHGWFAPESLLTGLAPGARCGLALAGADHGRDALGPGPGILTADELASFDFRHCELAVLSAHETTVGLRRAGQSIQSLQSALHGAGVRTAIMSLWRVDDLVARRFFESFYTKLWQEGLGRAAALWQAKMALRAEGSPPRDWAGWVLSGAPE